MATDQRDILPELDLAQERADQAGLEMVADTIGRAHNDITRLRAEVTARDALIAEALAALPEYSFLTSDTDWPVMVERAKAILSRAPQGAAERRGEAGDGPGPTDDPVPLGSGQRVAPDREVLREQTKAAIRGWLQSRGMVFVSDETAAEGADAVLAVLDGKS